MDVVVHPAPKSLAIEMVSAAPGSKIPGQLARGCRSRRNDTPVVSQRRATDGDLRTGRRRRGAAGGCPSGPSCPKRNPWPGVFRIRHRQWSWWCAGVAGAVVVVLSPPVAADQRGRRRPRDPSCSGASVGRPASRIGGLRPLGRRRRFGGGRPLGGGSGPRWCSALGGGRGLGGRPAPSVVSDFRGGR